jgi:hypothetical protein
MVAMTMAATLPDDSIWSQTTEVLLIIAGLASYTRFGFAINPQLGESSSGVIDLQFTTVQLNLTKRRLTLKHT